MPSDILTSIYSASNFALLWGIAAETTMEKNQRYLHVYSPELTPARNGDVVNKGSTTTIKLFNVNTQSYEERQVHLSSTIYAEYLNLTTDEDVPDIHKGQQVFLFQYKKGDRWFWIPMERDDYIKTFAHHRIRVPDIAIIHKTGEDIPEEEERVVALTDDNTYFLDIDTKYYKRIVLSTAGTDGEGFRYRITMDAKNHLLELTDAEVDPNDPTKVKEGTSNVIRIESDPVMSNGLVSGKITLQNKSGATFQLEGEDVKLVVPNNLTVEVGGSVVRHVKGAVGDTIEDNYELTVKKTMAEVVEEDKLVHVKGKCNAIYDGEVLEEMHDVYKLAVALAMEIQAESRKVTLLKTDILTAMQSVSVITKTATVTASSTTVTGAVFTMSCARVVSASKIIGCCK